MELNCISMFFTRPLKVPAGLQVLPSNHRALSPLLKMTPEDVTFPAPIEAREHHDSRVPSLCRVCFSKHLCAWLSPKFCDKTSAVSCVFIDAKSMLLLKGKRGYFHAFMLLEF